MGRLFTLQHHIDPIAAYEFQPIQHTPNIHALIIGTEADTLHAPPCVGFLGNNCHRLGINELTGKPQGEL